MEKKTKILLISASLLAIGGAIGFYIWWKNKNKPSTDVPLATDESGTSAPPTSSGTTPTADGPSNVKDFQDWLDRKGLKWVGATNSDLTNGKKLGQGSGYGNYGPSTQKAWAIYKGEYQKLSEVKNNLGKASVLDKNIVYAYFNNDAYYVVFYENNRFAIFAKGGKLLKKGSWSNGGKTLVVDAGGTFTSGSVWANVSNAIK
jgi:hypothetical protein